MGQAESVQTTLAKAAEIAPDDPRPQVKLAELNLLQRNLNMAWLILTGAEVGKF